MVLGQAQTHRWAAGQPWVPEPALEAAWGPGGTGLSPGADFLLAI
jgi:hypothetical protein